MRNKKTLVLIVALLVLCITLTLVITGCSKNGDSEEVEKVLYTNPLTGIESEEPIEAARPLQVSIDNVGAAIPQSWLSKADIVYEVPVEGNQTRLQAIFYGQFPENFGPIRSTRPCFVDIAREYKAVFLAHGWSPEAKTYLMSNVIPYINAMNSDIGFYRVSDKPAPHNSYVSWENVKSRIEEKGWWDEKQDLTHFQFLEIVEPVEEEEEEESVFDFLKNDEEEEEKTEEPVEEVIENPSTPATYISLNYGAAACEYTYNPETNLYTRTRNGNQYIDKETGESITTSNVIVQRVSSSVLDQKGRLNINMCSGGKATLYTGGKAIEGTWSRASLDSRTVFVDENGNQFQLTPGTTWVQLANQSCRVSHR